MWFLWLDCMIEIAAKCWFLLAQSSLKHRPLACLLSAGRPAVSTWQEKWEVAPFTIAGRTPTPTPLSLSLKHTHTRTSTQKHLIVFGWKCKNTYGKHSEMLAITEFHPCVNVRWPWKRASFLHRVYVCVCVCPGEEFALGAEVLRLHSRA